MSIKIKKVAPFLVSLFLFILLTAPMFTFAASDKDYFPICDCCANGGTINGVQKPEYPCSFLDFFAVVDKLMKALLYLSFFIAVIMIIWGGITIILGAGQEAKRTKGRQTITWAIYGMLVAFGAWLIINTVLTVFTGEGISESLKFKI